MTRAQPILRRALAGWHATGTEVPPAKRAALYEQGLLPNTLDADALRQCGVGSARVAVVGAGLAGLSAAWYLERAGLAVTVFEAADYAGGRVLTDHRLIPGKIVEAGAELIGTNHAMWFELKDLFGLTLVEVTEADEYVGAGLDVRLRLGDHDLTDAERTEVEAVLQGVFDGIGRDAFAIDPVRPWASTHAAAFDAMSVADGLTRHFGPVSSLARTVLEFVIANDNCAPVERQSYLGLLALVSAGRMSDTPEGMRGYWDYTETHRCWGGNQQLATGLAGTLADLRYSTPVELITVASDGVGVSYGGAAGASESFDYLILTAPPTAWPAVEATPGFDPRRYTMAHGPAVKYLTGFDHPFWLDQGLAPSALWDELGSVWEGTDRQTTPDHGFGLSVYAGGPYVAAAARCAAKLAELYPGESPLAARYLDWPRTPYINTGYSVPAPGQVTTVGRALSEPFAGRLFFAGEQACLGFFGYMEGALQSGARAARRLVGQLCPRAVPGMLA